jgi:hypothetical protein
MNAFAYAWAWGPLVLTAVMLVGYAATKSVTDERARREAQGLPPMQWWIVISFAAGGAVLAAIGFLIFLA